MNILIARTARDIETAYEKLSKAEILGCDTETSSLSAQRGEIFSVQFSDGEFNVLIPLSEGVSLEKFSLLLENPRITKVFHNAKFDLNFLRENSYTVENVFCTMTAEKVLTKGANQSVSLAETLYRYFAVDLDKSQRANFNRKWNKIWTPELVRYALADVVHLPRLMNEQKAWLERLGLRDEFSAQMTKVLADK